MRLQCSALSCCRLYLRFCLTGNTMATCSSFCSSKIGFSLSQFHCKLSRVELNDNLTCIHPIVLGDDNTGDVAADFCDNRNDAAID